jgi:HlyD family secretion protein
MGMKFVGVLTLLASVVGCGLHGRPRVERPPLGAAAFAVAPEGPAAVELGSVVAPGIVEPWGEQFDLAAQESGRIAEIAVEEGDVVQPGQLLARLDDGIQQRTVEIAAADLAQAEAALEKTERGATAEELDQARAEVDAAAARERLAVATAERTFLLYGEGVVTDDERERAEAEVRTQSALAERARARLRELERGPRPEDRTVARVQVEAARARLKLAQESVRRRSLTAPVAGTILLSRFQPGEYYNARGGALIVLGDMTRIQVRLEVDEIDAFDLSVGDACRISSDAGVRLAEGSVIRLAPKMGRRALRLESPTAREDLRVREVFVEVPASAGLTPGQRVWGRVGRIARPGRDQTDATRTDRSQGGGP